MPEKVEPMDPSKKNSPVAGPVAAEATIQMDAAGSTCVWNDQSFEEGSVVESGGASFECQMGQWVKKK